MRLCNGLAAALLLSTSFASAQPTTQPTMTKLTVEATDANEAARQITRQLGLDVRVENKLVPMKIDTGGEKPYAVALVELFKQAEAFPGEDRSPLWLIKRKPLYVGTVNDTVAVVIQRVGVEAFKATSPEYQSNDGFTYTIYANVFVDPAYRILGLMNESRADSVDCDAPVRMPDNSPSNMNYQFNNAMSNGQSAVQVRIQFRTSSEATAIKGFRTRLKAVAVVSEASVDLGVESAGQTVQGEGLTGELNLNSNGSRPTFSMKIGGPVLANFRNGGWFQGMNRFVSFQDINGEPLTVDNAGTQPGSDWRSFTFRFRPPTNNPNFLDEFALAKVRIPTKVKIIDFPIEVKDVNLPVK